MTVRTLASAWSSTRLCFRSSSMVVGAIVGRVDVDVE